MSGYTSTHVQMRGVQKSFGHNKVLKGVDIDVIPGEIHCVVGENGAGKSTLMKILAGIHTCDAGQIVINGRPVGISSPADAIRNGISMVHQELSQMPEMSVLDNLYLGNEYQQMGWIQNHQMIDDAKVLCSQLGVDIDVNRPVSSLSMSVRQLLEIAKALLRETRVLILDEPTSSLAPAETARLFEILRHLKDDNRAVIFISHKLDEVFDVGDKITVLRDGAVRVANHPIRDTTPNEVILSMVGRELSELYPLRNPNVAASKEPTLMVSNMFVGAKVKDVSFAVYPGEIVGLAGMIGSGRTELIHGIFGLQKISRGTMLFRGTPVTNLTPRKAARLGMALVPEDRRDMGLVMALSVLENLTMVSLSEYQRFGWIYKSTLWRSATEIMTRMRVKTSSPQLPISSLSGGNQQKVVIGKWLMRSLDLLIVDEPTRGIDVGAKVEVYELIRELANSGVAVLMVSSELPELIGMSDRILVFREGQLTGELPAGCREDQVIHLAV